VPMLQRAVDIQIAVNQLSNNAAERRQLSTFQLHLAVAQSKCGQSAPALTSLQAARQSLEQVSPHTARDFYNLACIAAHASQLLAAEQPERAEEEATGALSALRDAVAAGYRDVAYMEKDPDLALLRSRAEFQQLITELKEKKKAP